MFIFKNLRGNLNEITLESTLANQNYNLRDQYTLSIPNDLGRSLQSQKGVQYSATSMWNNLPIRLRTIDKIGSFKKYLKEFLISET